MTSIQVVPFVDDHLPGATALACARYRALCALVPALPPRYGDPAVVLPMLHELARDAPGVAAMRDGQFVGYVLWLPTLARGGLRTAYSPEWANGAAAEQSARVYEEMYATIAAWWVGEGRLFHLVGLLAHDDAAIAAWHRLGFGMLAADAARDLTPMVDVGANVAIRRASSADQESCAALDRALQQYLASAPTYLFIEDPELGPARVLGGPAHAVWLAEREGEPVAYLRIGPASEDACTIIRDPGTASITGAYTCPDARREGVGAALLDRALAWAREAGYVRCTVDWEPMNVLGARFWLRAFQPAVYTLARQIDARFAPRSD
ncbi:MAG: GNAT family N-acetyltransferase [Anaerolineae bacterium]|nr:GNAT family N-acetyltransferase [Anaerolineae bacterium]